MLYVDEVIGRGSFGTVYRGRLRSPDGLVRRVAVKVLSEKMSADTRAVSRFRDEARLLALIDHPGLVPVYALEQLGNRWAVVMGFVDGFELAGALAFGPLPPETVRQIGIQLADILDALWTHPHPDTREPLQVVHRDVKPHNVMIDAQGRVRLLDLGVASARFEARETLSVAGEVAGTLAYMSPQRWARRDDGHAGDIYALGATLYQLATGELAQEAGPHPDAHAERLAAGAEKMPALLHGLVWSAMAFDDKDRPEAAELAAALRRIGPLDGPSAMEWAAEMTETHDVRSSGLPDSQKHSSFLGHHDLLGTETTFLTAAFDANSDLLVDGWQSETHQANPAPAPPPPSRAGWYTIGGGLAIAAIAVAALVWAPQPTPPSPKGPPVTVALAPTHPKTVASDHEPIRKYLERELARPVEMVVGTTYEHTSNMLISGQVGFAQLPHGIGTKTMARSDEVRPLATKIVDGTASVDGYLVVRRDDDATALEQMVGSTICYADKDSNTGYKLPRAWLYEQGYDPDTDFGTRVSGDHESVLRDVIEGRCRLGGTFNRNLLTADARGIPGSRLKVFALTDSVPHDSWYAGPSADPNISTGVEAALLALDPPIHTGSDVVGEYERISGFGPPPHRP